MRALLLSCVFLSACGSAPVATTDPPPPVPAEAGSGSVDPATWGPTQCPSPAETSDLVKQIAVADCDTGAPRTLDEVCGAKATWIFAAHTHCPTCQKTATFTPDIARAVAAKGVAVVHLVHDDNGVSCAEWRSRYALAGLSNVRVYADPNEAAWTAIKLSNTTAAHAFLDRARIVTYRGHGLSASDVTNQIDVALSR